MSDPAPEGVVPGVDLGRAVGGELERVPGVGTAVAVAATLVVTVAVTVVRPVTHQAQHGGNQAVEAREARSSEPITARDVAAAVGRSPGHVTTVVRRRTGRTVGRWVPNGASRRPGACSPRPT